MYTLLLRELEIKTYKAGSWYQAANQFRTRWDIIYSSPSTISSSRLETVCQQRTYPYGTVENLLLLLSIRDTSILVLLVLADKIVHVALSLSELHLVHTLTSVPMQESLATEHGSELVTNTLEELLDGGGVTNEGGGHAEAARGDGAKSSLDVVGDPLDEVGAVLGLDVAHLVLNLLHGDLTTAVKS